MNILDHQSITRLWDEHSAALVLYAQQLCDWPEDVVQEAFMLLLRQNQGLDNPKAWLYRVVRNRALNVARSGRRRSHREATTAVNGTVWFETTDADRLDAREATDALGQLAGPEREAIVARLWGGLSFEEIARLSGSSASTVYRCYQRGLRTLRERLGWSCLANETKTRTKT